MREIFKPLFGNERLKKTLGEAIETGAASHAYILDGPKGSGKHTAATLAAAALACEHRTDEKYPLPCGVCPVCGRIIKGISADLIVVSKEDKASIGVGKIRAIREDLYVTPNDSDKKVYVIEDADLMTAQAQNALLISLEEPPPFVTFFLLTENAEALLDTIKSRAVTLRMELFSPERIKEFLSGISQPGKTVPDLEERYESAIEGSNGSLGEAKRIFTDFGSKDDNFSETIKQFSAMLVKGKTSDSLEIITPYLSDGFETAKKILTSVTAAVAGMIRCKKVPETKNGSVLSAENKDALKTVSLARLVTVFDLTTEALTLISSNVTPKTVIYDLIFKCRK